MQQPGDCVTDVASVDEAASSGPASGSVASADASAVTQLMSGGEDEVVEEHPRVTLLESAAIETPSDNRKNDESGKRACIRAPLSKKNGSATGCRPPSFERLVP